MLKLLTCARNHFWEARDSNGETPTAQERCPVCGAPAESLPLLDLAPSAATDQQADAAPHRPPLPLRDESGLPVVTGYEILENLGRSRTGMALYRARQTVVNRIVLLKVVMARDDPSQRAWGSLRGEATALGKLAHPNVVQILEAGERDRQLFYNAVELIDGPTLEQKTVARPLPFRQVLALVEILARAVHHAHKQGIVHRNLKPSSILLTPRQSEGREPAGPPGGLPEPPYCRLHSADYLPKITDFGLARRPVEGEILDAELQGGMPSYLTPEQACGRAREIGPATDVYALGAILYSLLTTRPPFQAETESEMLDAIQYKKLVPPSFVNRRVPADLDTICRKCLARQPRCRYTSARELAEDLRRCGAGYPIHAEPPGAARRLGKWVRRQPAVTLALVFLSLVVSLTAYLAGGSPTTGKASHTTRFRSRSDPDRSRAELQRLQEREGQARYYHTILLAERAWQAGHENRANELLDRCDLHRRHWEWNYLRQRVRGEPPVVLRRAREPVRNLAFSSDGQYVAVAVANYLGSGGGKQGAVRLWHTATGRHLRAIPFGGPVWDIAFSPDGTRLAVAGSGRQPRQGLVAIYALLQIDPVAPPNPFDSPILSIAYSPDGSLLLAAGADGRVRTLSPTSGAEFRFSNFAQPVSNFAQPVLDDSFLPTAPLAVLSHEGDRVACTSPDQRTIRFQDSLRGRWYRELAGHTDRVTALAYSREVHRLASASLDQTVRVWDPDSGETLQVLRGHSAGVRAVAFTPDGKRLVTAGLDGTIMLWDPVTGEEVLPLGTFKESVPAVAFSPDGSRLAIAQGNEVTIWSGSPNLDLGRP